MKPTCYDSTTELAGSAELNTYKHNFINMCGCLYADRQASYH